MSIKTIQHRLNTSGVLTRRGNTKWSLGSIQLMLRSTVYGGYYDYHDKMIGETVRIQAPVIIDAATLDQTLNRRQFNKQSAGPVKHFYLLRRLLWCGHCGLVMGVRSNNREDGHYYCVSSERLWKNRDQDHPKWQRGASCSAVRSIKISLTNQYVWKVAQQLHEFIDKHQPSQHLFVGPHLPHRRDSNSLPSEQYRTELANDLESVDEATQREIIETTFSRISVFYDTDSKKHRLCLTLTEQVTRCLQAIDDTTASVTAESFGNSCDSLILSEPSHRVVATDLRSQSQSECGVKGVDHHGGINEFSELAQTPSKAPLTYAEWTSGLLVLTVSPLSPYQQQLIDRIQTLSQDGWTGRQIAKHFNEAGYLTPKLSRITGKNFLQIVQEQTRCSASMMKGSAEGLKKSLLEKTKGYAA